MWAGVVLADTVADLTADFGGVHLVPAGDPAAIGELAERLDVGWLVIAAHPSLAARADLAAALAAGRSPRRFVTRLTSPHAPIATLCALSQARATFSHPGRGFELARHMLDQAWSGAWTTRVSRLNEPPPSMTQHFRSFLPGGFLIRHWPGPAVFSGHHRAAFANVPGGQVLVTEEGVPAKLGSHLLSMAADSTWRVSLGGTWESVYGIPQVAQMALLPADVQSLIAPVSQTCPSCGLELSMLHCPFCKVAARPRASAGLASMTGHR